VINAKALMPDDLLANSKTFMPRRDCHLYMKSFGVRKSQQIGRLQWRDLQLTTNKGQRQ
jgi:hypothetical protein